MTKPASIWTGFRQRPGTDLSAANQAHAAWIAVQQQRAAELAYAALVAKGRC